MIKTRRTKRTYSPEFKLEAIEQVVKYQRDVREVAQALELNPDHLRKWIRLYKQELQGIESTGNAIAPEQREIQQLKAQIKRLEMEKETLKQAAVLMSEVPGKHRANHTAESKVAYVGSLSFIRCSPQRLLRADETFC
ncbi:hypothetical protein GCM10022405_46760 [Gibbsiella dentisursi]|uniref:Transposase n=1 Tax=Gibbsiella dentisursi TaxID=796890 RepID=A0ABP7M7C9_9GAMM